MNTFFEFYNKEFETINVSYAKIYINDKKIQENSAKIAQMAKIQPCLPYNYILLLKHDLGPSFSFDARKDENWTDIDFVMDSSWKNAKECNESNTLPYVLKKRPIKKLVYEKINGTVHSGGEFDYRNKDDNPAIKMYNAFLRTDNSFYKYESGEITVTNDNTYLILDLGAESAGYFNIEMTAPEGVKIDVGYGEHLKDLRVRTVIANQRYSFEYFSKEGYQCQYIYMKIYLEIFINRKSLL